MVRGQLRTKAVCRPLFRLAAPALTSLLLLVAGRSAVLADEFRTPTVSAVHVEWRAVLDQLRSEINTQPSVAANFTFSSQRRVPASDPRSTPALVQLNAVTSQLFTGIGRSPVPVLLPFDTAAFLDARSNGAPASLSLARYQADFRPADLFDAGQAGYDAMFALDPGAGDGMPPRVFARPVEVQITGSILAYDINDPLGGKGEPVKALQAQFPDLRRFIREGYVRYAFTRFGVPYVVSIQCLDSAARGTAARLPRGLSRRRTFPQSVAYRRRPTFAGAHGYSVQRLRTAAGMVHRVQLSAGGRHHRQQRLSQARRPRRPDEVLPDQISDRKKPRPSCDRNPSASAINPNSPAGDIPGAIISANPAALKSANAPVASAIRARISAPGACPRQQRTGSLRSQATRRCSRYATAS